MSEETPIDVMRLSAFDKFRDIAYVDIHRFSASSAKVKMLFFKPAMISVSLSQSYIRNKLWFYAEGFAKENYAIMGNKKYIGVDFNTDVISVVTVRIHTPRNKIAFTTNTQNDNFSVTLNGITYVEFYIETYDVYIDIYTQTYNTLRRMRLI